MNNNKRNKNRPTGISRYPTENRQPKGRPPAQGVYSNSYFMHSATALVGNVVELRLRSGSIYEGVFRTFSSTFDVALELPSCINSDERCSPEANCMIFPADQVVNIKAKDFDANYVTEGAFQTDAAISEKCNGSRFEEKELEPFDATGMNGDIDIELDNANGWDANEMFQQNENQFGVTSTFDDSLSLYTVKLDKMDSDEFKEAEARAEKLAAEIENNPTCRDRLDLENGDEEALYAAVERPFDKRHHSYDMERDRDRDRERERERERDYERERERENERERERDREERERERERERDRERERERERDRDRNKRMIYEPREVMTERYITKPTRSITGPPPPVALSASMGSARGHERDRERERERDREFVSERNERMSQTTMHQANSAQSSVLTTAGMKNSSSTLSSNANMGSDNASKYGGSMMKRKTGGSGGNGNAGNSSAGGQQGKGLMRNTNMPNTAGGSGTQTAMSNSSGSSNLNTASNTGGNKNNNNSGYSSMPAPQSQSNYPNYSQMLHGSTQYRNQSHMSGVQQTKLNGDASNSGNSNATNKPLPQRNMRQYPSGAPNNQPMSYSETAASQMNKPMHQHAAPPSVVNSSVSPPLQQSQSQTQQQTNVPTVHAGVVTNQPPPQPQRPMRQTREGQLQDLRQFGQDFQLAGAPQTAPGQQQQQQLLVAATQPTLQRGAPLQPQPSVSPPQQQQQQQQQQQAHIVQTQQQHVAMQHVQPVHHVPPPHMAPTHLAATQQPPTHYLPPQLAQQQQQKPQQQQHAELLGMSKGLPPPPQSIVNTMQAPPPLPAQQPQQQQQQQTQLPQDVQTAAAAQQTLYHTLPPPVQQQQQQAQTPQQQTTAVIISASAVDNTQLTPTQAQQQQQHLVSKDVTTPTAAGIVSQTNSTPSPSTTPGGSVAGSSADKTQTTANGSNTAGGGNTATTTTAPKKHVLNPSAKPFTPRSPSTPNPSRPHTPQTPVPMTGIYTAGTHVATNQTPIYVMQPQQPTAFQAPPHSQPGQQPRMRRGNYEVLGQMAATQMHVSATTATGQPLLATGPIQQYVYHQGPHGPHFPSQPYTPMVRMYPDQPPQQIQFLAQTPPSTTPSPGQPHQPFHPPPQPSPAGGGPQPAYAPQTQQPAFHVIPCPVLHPQLMPNHYYPATPQHPPQGQQFQIVMQQHPTQ